jgi:hypothetical protein
MVPARPKNPRTPRTTFKLDFCNKIGHMQTHALQQITDLPVEKPSQHHRQTCAGSHTAPVIAALLQIDGLVVPLVVELSGPYFVRTLVFALTEADECPKTHVKIAQAF